MTAVDVLVPPVQGDVVAAATVACRRSLTDAVAGAADVATSVRGVGTATAPTATVLLAGATDTRGPIPNRMASEAAAQAPAVVATARNRTPSASTRR